MKILNEKEISIINDVINLYKQIQDQYIQTGDVLADAQSKHRAKKVLIEYLNNLDESDVKTVMAISYIGSSEFASEKTPEYLLAEWRKKVSDDFDDKDHRINHLSSRSLDRFLIQGLGILNK